MFWEFSIRGSLISSLLQQVLEKYFKTREKTVFKDFTSLSKASFEFLLSSESVASLSSKILKLKRKNHHEIAHCYLVGCCCEYSSDDQWNYSKKNLRSLRFKLNFYNLKLKGVKNLLWFRFVHLNDLVHFIIDNLLIFFLRLQLNMSSKPVMILPLLARNVS